MTKYVFLWEGPDGKRYWEAVREEQINGFLEKLIKGGVLPATIMVGYAPILFHWVWKKYHKGLSDVNFCKINEEIYGTEPVGEVKHTPVDVPIEKKKPETKYGWIAPDGRFFGCEYSQHTSLARKIVGEIQHVFDPERHLEELGWAKVFKGMADRERYAIGMGEGKKLTDVQLRTVQEMGLDNAYGISHLL
nr:hypothetical protein [uncultured Oscillibacter sp.]